MTTISSLKKIVPLALALMVLLSYEFIGAQWSSAPSNPPNNNVPAPINGGIDINSSQFIKGWLSVDTLVSHDNIVINDGAPEIFFDDTSYTSGGFNNWFIGTKTDTNENINKLVFSEDKNDDGQSVWADDGPWAMQVTSDYVKTDSQMRAPEYCDENGANCVTTLSAAGGAANVTLHRATFNAEGGSTWNAHFECRDRGHDGVWAVSSGNNEHLCFRSADIADNNSYITLELRSIHAGRSSTRVVTLIDPVDDLFMFARASCNIGNNVRPNDVIRKTYRETSYDGDKQSSGIINSTNNRTQYNSNYRIIPIPTRIGSTKSIDENAQGDPAVKACEIVKLHVTVLDKW